MRLTKVYPLRARTVTYRHDIEYQPWTISDRMTTNDSAVGHCPRCGTPIHEGYVLIEYETDDGETAAWAECPSCSDVVDPQ